MRLTITDLERYARLQEAIDRKDAARGRPLTDREKLENLWRELAKCESDCATRADPPGKCDCGADSFRSR